MKFLSLFHQAFVILFALINGTMLYLFLMNLPYGIDPLLVSLRHWEQLSPQIGNMLSLSAILSLIAVVLCRRLSGERKNSLLYFRRRFPHPAFNAFLNTRKQPFDSKTLLQAHSEIKDAGFDPQKQIDTWLGLYRRHKDTPVVVNTTLHWQLLRDLYLISVLFLWAFSLSLLWNYETPAQLIAVYLFVFGAQTLFLFLTARRVGWKMIDNVLAVDLGMKEGESQQDNNTARRGRGSR